MSFEETLFGDVVPSDEPETFTPPAMVHMIEDQQVARLRALLNEIGPGDMSQRQACIETR